MVSLGSLPTLVSTRSQQRLIADLKSRLDTAQHEAVTGRAADITQATRGDVGKVQKLDKLLNDNERFNGSLARAETEFEITQSILSNTRANATEFSISLEGAIALEDEVSKKAQADAAGVALDSVVASINTSSGGRSLFSGAAIDTPAISSAQAIIDDVAAIISAAPDAATAITNLDTYFGAGGGFETGVYQGSTTPAPSNEISPGRRLAPGLTALDDDIKATLRAFATVAAAPDNAIDAEANDALLSNAAEQLRVAEGGLVSTQTRLGAQQEEIASLQARNQAEGFTLQRARNALLERDQYEAAAEFSALETQIQSSFLTTARISNLSLVNYL